MEGGRYNTVLHVFTLKSLNVSFNLCLSPQKLEAKCWKPLLHSNMRRKFNKTACTRTILLVIVSNFYRLYALKRADGYRAYVIPGGTSVPDSLLFLQDTRLDTSKEYERGYFMAPSEACYPHEFEKLLVDFVMQKDHFCFSLYNSPQGGRNLPCNTIGSGTVE